VASSRSPTESNDFSWRSSRSSIRASRKRASRDRSPRMVSPIKASARQPRSQPVHHRNCRRCAAFRAISAQFSPEAVPRAVTVDSPPPESGRTHNPATSEHNRDAQPRERLRAAMATRPSPRSRAVLGSGMTETS